MPAETLLNPQLMNHYDMNQYLIYLIPALLEFLSGVYNFEECGAVFHEHFAF